MSIEGIQCAIRNVRIAKDMLNAEVARTYPVGTEVAFEKRGNRLVCVVEGHGGTGRVGELRVKNPRTNKSYWITMYDVVGYVG